MGVLDYQDYNACQIGQTKFGICYMIIHSSPKETQLFRIIHSCSPWVRVSDPRSFSTLTILLIMTLGH